MSKADRASTTRRSLLADTAVLAGLAGGFSFLAGPATGAPVPAQPDAALLAYGPRLATLQAEVVRLNAEVDRTHDLLTAMTAACAQDGGSDARLTPEQWRHDCDRSGYTAAQDAFDHAVWRLNDALDLIIDIPAQTLGGLCLKARYAAEYEDLAENIIHDLVAIDLSRAGM